MKLSEVSLRKSCFFFSVLFLLPLGWRKKWDREAVKVRIMGPDSQFEIIFNEAICQEETCLNTMYQFFSGLKEVSIQSALLKGPSVFKSFHLFVLYEFSVTNAEL